MKMHEKSLHSDKIQSYLKKSVLETSCLSVTPIRIRRYREEKYWKISPAYGLSP